MPIHMFLSKTEARFRCGISLCDLTPHGQLQSPRCVLKMPGDCGNNSLQVDSVEQGIE